MKILFLLFTACMGLFGTEQPQTTNAKQKPPAGDEYFRVWFNGNLHTNIEGARLAKTFNSAQSYVQGNLSGDKSFYLLVKAASTGAFPFGDVAQKRSTARFVFSSATDGFASDYTACSGAKEKTYAKGYVVITKQPQKTGDYLEGYIAAEPMKKEAAFTGYFLDFCNVKEGSIRAEFRLKKDF